jgi:hypothetical protein
LVSSKPARNTLLGVLGAITLVTLFIAWPIRDQEMVVRLQRIGEPQPVQMYNEKIFCNGLPECFRIVNKLVVSGSRILIEGMAGAFHVLPGSIVTDVPSWAPQYTKNLGPYLFLRVLILIALAFLLRVYLRRWWLVAVMSNVLLFWSSGVPVRAVTRGYEWLLSLIGRTDFYPNLSSWHVSRNSTIFLLEYDYVALAAVLAFPLLLRRGWIEENRIRLLAIGALLAVTFENLAAVFIIAMLWSQWHRTKSLPIRSSILIATGWLIPIGGLIVYARLSNPNASLPLVEITRLGYSINSGYRPLVLRLLVLFLVLPFLLGLLTDFILRRFGVTQTWAHELRPYVHGVVLGLMFSYLVGYFHSALATEFGRQSLGAQVLLFLSGLMTQQARVQRKRVQTPSVTAQG